MYADLLGQKIRTHGARVWLVNTGWTGGRYGVGSRMKLPYTRAMITAALEGTLDNAPTVTDPVFGLRIPTVVPGVPGDVLVPRTTWSESSEYDRAAAELAGDVQA